MQLIALMKDKRKPTTKQLNYTVYDLGTISELGKWPNKYELTFIMGPTATACMGILIVLLYMQKSK